MTPLEYRQEAQRRWPDDMDMAWDGPDGSGRWATVAWCGPVSVMLHRTQQAAERSMAIMQLGCGHRCQGDHQLVDLDEPERISAELEAFRLACRLEHLEDCRTCRYVFGGKAPDAARRRTALRMARAAA